MLFRTNQEIMLVKITSVRIKNYKSHHDSGEVSFGDHYTVIVGQNGAGKTAFLEAINPNTLGNVPPRA
jgi:DNA repair exonuclease SbcCD ATPase subunit